jgi:uncharacterized protein (TIGR02284 family)
MLHVGIAGIRGAVAFLPSTKGALMSTVVHSPSASTSEVVVVLNSCIEVCTDGQKGFAAAAANVRDPALKFLLQLYSDERAEFVLALQRAVLDLGAFPENEGTIRGVLHRGWVDAQLTLVGRSDHSVLKECVRGESAALSVYESALSHGRAGSLPRRVRVLVQRQFLAVRDAHAELQRRERATAT